MMKFWCSKGWEDGQKENAKKVKNATIRRQYEDIEMGRDVLCKYRDWVQDTGKAAIKVADEEREAFYQDLL